MVVNIVCTSMPQSQAEIWCLRLTLDLKGDKSQCFNHRDELDSAVQLPSRVVDGMLYIAQASYIYRGYIWAQANKFDQPYLTGFVRESST